MRRHPQRDRPNSLRFDVSIRVRRLLHGGLMRSVVRRFARVAPLALAAYALAPASLSAQGKEFLFVGNSLGGDISIVAIPSHKVVGTIPATVVGNHPDDVIASRSGDVLYISRLDVNDVIAVSTTTEKMLWRAEVPGIPNHL